MRLENLIQTWMKLIRRVADYVSVGMTAMLVGGLSLVSSIVVRNMLNPVTFGFFVSSGIALSYVGITELGVTRSMVRDVPYLRASGGNEAANRLVNVSFTYAVCVAPILAALLLVLVSLSLPENQPGSGMLALGIRLNGAVAALSSVTLYIDSMLRVDLKFRRYSATTTIQYGVTFAATIALVHLYGFVGLYAGTIAGLLTKIAMNIGALRQGSFTVDLVTLKEMIWTGFPLLITFFIWSVMLSASNLVTTAYLGMAAVGAYSIATTTYSTAMLIPQSMNQVMYPKMSLYYGSTNSQDALVARVGMIVRILGPLTAFVLVILDWILPYFVTHFLPAYVRGISAAQILLFGVGMMAVATPYGNIVTLLRRNSVYVLIVTVATAANFGASILLVEYYESSIDSVARGTSLAYCAYSFMLVFFISRITNATLIHLLLNTYLPFLTIYFPAILLSSSVVGNAKIIGVTYGAIAVSLYVYSQYRHSEGGLWKST